MTGSCAYCGAGLSDGAVFCPTCGRAQPALTATSPRESVPPALVEPPATERVSVPTRAPEPRRSPPPVRRTTRPSVRVPVRPAGQERSSSPASAAVPVVPGPAPLAPSAPPTSPVTEPLLPVPELGPARPIADGPVETRSAAEPPPRFVLQFSTGESLIARGVGIIGRTPAPEPGEVADQLIPLADAGRSVSKNHASFGIEGGRFWVSDRWSTNGTVLRAPGEPPVRCEPGRRHFVERGTRVDIGDQFFVVS